MPAGPLEASYNRKDITLLYERSPISNRRPTPELERVRRAQSRYRDRYRPANDGDYSKSG